LPATSVTGTPDGGLYLLKPGEIGHATAQIGKPGGQDFNKSQTSTGYPVQAGHEVGKQ